MKENGYIGNTNALKYKTQEQLQEGIDAYFQECDEKDKPYTMSGLAYSLGLCRKTVVNYGNSDLFYTQIKQARDKVQAQLEENALMGKSNSVFTIFTLKNNYGWRDTVEVNNKENDGILQELVEAIKNAKKPE